MAKPARFNTPEHQQAAADFNDLDQLANLASRVHRIENGNQRKQDRHGHPICTNCEKPFTPKRDWQLFCRTKCRTEWHAQGGQQIKGLYIRLVKHLEAFCKAEITRRFKETQREVKRELIASVLK